MKKSNTPKPPKGLSPAARRWWTRLRAGYGIDDDGGLAVLTEGAWAVHRAEEAKAIVDAEGLVTHDRWGQSKPHPAVATERDARGAVLRALKQLNLDLEPLRNGPGRPSGYKGVDYGV
jgi:phage terminase small subunit